MALMSSPERPSAPREYFNLRDYDAQSPIPEKVQWYLVKAERMTEPSALEVYTLPVERCLTFARCKDNEVTLRFAPLHVHTKEELEISGLTIKGRSDVES